MADYKSTMFSPLSPYLTQWYDLFPTQFTYSDGDNPHNPSRSKSGAKLMKFYSVCGQKWDAGWGWAVLKEATGLQEEESTAWVEGEKDS